MTVFFDNISALFKEENSSKVDIEPNVVNEPISDYNSEKLLELTDKLLLREIKPLLKKNKVLEAVEVCAMHYKGKYKAMTFKDWFKLVNKVYQNINAQL